MRIETYLANRLGYRVGSSVISSAQRSLRRLGKDFMLLGENSPLCSVWDEICLQQRKEESFYWPAYQHIIDQVLLDKMNRLDYADIMALWTLTDEGFDWIIEHREDKDGSEQVPMDPDTVLAYLRALLLRNSIDEDNKRVERYLYPDNTVHTNSTDARMISSFNQNP